MTFDFFPVENVLVDREISAPGSALAAALNRPGEWQPLY
jgi:hypothetical protein